MVVSFSYDSLILFSEHVEHAKSPIGKPARRQVLLQQHNGLRVAKQADRLQPKKPRTFSCDYRFANTAKIVITKESIYVRGNQINSKFIFEVFRIQCEQ